jgi:hypothetical protein
MNLQPYQQQPPEFKQFLADLDRYSKLYPLEFRPEQLEPKRKQPSATAKSDSLSIMINALQQARLI